MVALTRAVPPSLVACELTHLDRVSIDIDKAIEQHTKYEKALAASGCAVEHISATPDLPDSVFVEDTAVVLPEIAIVTRPGAESRRAETTTVAEVLSRYRDVVLTEAPGTIDGGDVLVVGDQIYVGQSSRTNAAGIEQLRKLTSSFGYSVNAVSVTGCLHLKSAVTEVADHTVLLNPSWIDWRLFAEFTVIEVDPREPHAANALRVGGNVIYPAEHVDTRQRLEERGIVVHTIEVSELAKAEAGVTCCSILIPN